MQDPNPLKHSITRLLLLLSLFSCVRLCATPWTVAHQAPPSMGFSRQEYWSGVPTYLPIKYKVQCCGSFFHSQINLALLGLQFFKMTSRWGSIVTASSDRACSLPVTHGPHCSLWYYTMPILFAYNSIKTCAHI